MTNKLFLEDPYCEEFDAKVVGINDGGIELDCTAFYATSGGQPGDIGVLKRGAANDEIIIIATKKGAAQEDVLHMPAEGCALPEVGETVRGRIDWDARHKHMRMHTALHLMCACVEGDVTGGQIGAEKSRLDFNIPGDAVDKDTLTERLNKLIEEDHPVSYFWITEEEMAEKPEMVRTMSVKPPSESGRIRMVQIGPDDSLVDLQPCGGTHVKSTGEIGTIKVAKIENKGKQNRRISIIFDEGG